MEDNRMNLEEDMLPGEEEAMDQFDLTDDSFDDVTLESQGWEYVDSKDVYDEDGFRDVYYWYKKDGLHRFFFSSDVDYGDPEYFDWETESDEAAEEWFNTYDLQESLTEDFLRVNGKSYPIKDKSFLNGKKASYGNEHGLEHIMVVTKGDKKYDIYDSGFGNMSHADRCAILKEEFEDDDCTLEDIADQVEVNTPLHRDAPKPYPENYLINETSFADEMRAKYYEARVEDGVIKLSWITQEPFDETDVEAFKEELERFFEYTIEVSGYTKPVQVDVEVKCRDGAEEGYAEFTMRFQDKPVENITEEKEAKPAMTFTEFLNNCIAGGGNWAAMLMSGIKKVFPDKYAEMEDRQYTFEELLNIISECGVKVDEDSDDIQEGISDNMSAEDIAKKHDVPVEDIKAQLEKGIKVEKEHTDDEKKAERIALDHLFEIPDYYDRLNKMEKSALKEGVVDTNNYKKVIYDAIRPVFTTIFADEWFDKDSLLLTANDNEVAVTFRVRKDPYIINYKWDDFLNAMKAIDGLKLKTIHKKKVKPSWEDNEYFRVDDITFKIVPEKSKKSEDSLKESGWNDVAPRYKNTEIEYKGETLPVRSEWWTDYNNMWLYTVIDKIKYKNGFYEICKERDVDGGKLFALETYDLDESLKEDTVKQGSSWVNKGKEGTHGKFRTKKAADAQRRAMFANGYKESFNPSSNDYTLTTVGDMIDGLIGNMSDDEIDSDLRTWRKISKQFNFRPAVDNIAVLIPDEGYDPADYFPFWAGEPRSVKGTDLVYYDTPFFCVKEVKNGRTFLYFDSEEAARYYVDLIDSGMDLEDQDAYSEWVDKNPLVRESLKEAVEATPSPEDASVADSIITAIEDEWKTIALYNSIITRLKDNNFADMIPVIQDIVEEENVHVGQLQKALETISPDTAKIQSGEVEAEGQLDDKSEEDLKLQEEYFSYFPENYYLVKVISDGDWVDWGILPRKSTKGKEIEDYKRDFLKKYEDVKFFAMDKNGKVLNEVRVREEDEEPAVESLKESLDDDDDIDIEGERWEDIYEYGDDTDEYDDFELAGIYGGDLTYCPICGRRLEYDEDGDQFCPKCEKSAWTLAQERRKLDKERNSESVEENSDDDLVEDWSPNEWAVRGEDQLELAMEDPGMPDDDEEDEVPSPAVQKRLRGRRFTDRDGEFLRHPAREDVSERENEKKIRDAIEDDDINPDDIVEYTLNNTPDEMLSGVVDMIDESKLEDDPAVDISDLRPDVDFEQGKKQLQEFGPVAAAVVSAVAPVVADKVLDKVLPEEQQVKSEDDDTVYGSKEDDVDESVLTTI